MPFDDRGFQPHPLRWMVEPLTEQPSYIEKAMFGCRACYLHGRPVLVMASRGEEPWQGLLVPTDKANHESLLGEFPELVIHPVLAKWLDLPEEIEDFEEAVSRLVGRIALDDPRLGVVPQPRKRPGGKGRRGPALVEPETHETDQATTFSEAGKNPSGPELREVWGGRNLQFAQLHRH